jgi:hypothetical protein
MVRKRIRVRPRVARRTWEVEILPLEPRDELVMRAKQVLWRKRAA